MQDWVVLGKVLGPHGIRGWVRIYSETRPAENIFSQSQWWLGPDRRPFRLIEKGRSGKAMIALLASDDVSGSSAGLLQDRDQALALRNLEIAVPRQALPASKGDSNYWADMIGLQVETLEGESLGRVVRFLESAAHDVLVSEEGDQEWLIPFVRDEIVDSVNLDSGVIRVKWSREWV